VSYVLEGSVRKAGGRVRITAQLVDATNGSHLWADHFDGFLEDVFELQDQVAFSVAGVIEPALQAAEIRRPTARPTTDLTAYDLYLRALAIFFPIPKKRVLEGLGLLDRRLQSIGITGQRYLGRRSVTYTSSQRTGRKSRRHCGASLRITRGRRSRWRVTTRTSSSIQPKCWHILARTSAP
jgi:hypothetical protein